MKQLEGKIAFITGAAMGMGRGIAQVMAERGALVLLADIDPKVEDVASALGNGASSYLLDISQEKVVEQTGREILSKYGRVDILVNNAGILRPIDPCHMDSDLRDFHYRINVCGCWNCTRAFFPSMLARGYGRVVNLSSVTGPRVADPGMVGYAMSKGAILGMTKALAMDGVQRGVTVNAILPGYVRTHMVERTARLERPEDPEGFLQDICSRLPMGRMADPREVGYLAAFLASDEAAYITGGEFVIDGANGLVETH